jgi:Uma2 family endonuclease
MPATALVTSEQYLTLPDEFHDSGERIRDELIAGEVIHWPFLPMVHSLVVAKIAKTLWRFESASKSSTYRVMIATGFQVDEYNTFVPDVSLVPIKTLRQEVRIIQGPPPLAIEVVAPSDLEIHLRRKINAYRQNGAERVWVVYPDCRSVIIYSRDSMQELKGDQIIEDPLLPGFSAPVSTFFQLA